MKNILHQFIKSQTPFGMARGDKMTLVLNEPKQIALSFKFNHYLRPCIRNGRKKERNKDDSPMLPPMCSYGVASIFSWSKIIYNPGTNIKRIRGPQRL
jgi:hypothetical protein